MAFCVPFPLWQRTSRIYQDHRWFPAGSSLPSSRLPISGVSAQLSNRVMPYGEYSCRLLAHSMLFADSSSGSPAPFGGRSLANLLSRHSLTGAGHLPVAGPGSLLDGQRPGSGRRHQLCCVSAAFSGRFWSADILYHFCRVILCSGLQDHIEYSDQLACHCNQ